MPTSQIVPPPLELWVKNGVFGISALSDTKSNRAINSENSSGTRQHRDLDEPASAALAGNPKYLELEMFAVCFSFQRYIRINKYKSW